MTRIVTSDDPRDAALGDMRAFSPSPAPAWQAPARPQWRMARRALFVIPGALAMLLVAMLSHGHARDDGSFANSPLKPWFDQLASGKGLCCSFADGLSISDVDWDTATTADASGTPQVRYRVRVDGHWIVVPPQAVVTEPNKYGPAVVWPYQDAAGQTQIRCFMPGAGT